jgi:hypothetical protein
MKAIFNQLILVFLFVQLGISQDDIQHDLFELPDVIFKEIDTPENYHSAYELKIKQPIDHKNPGSGHFYQRVWLSHKDYGSPTVLITNGYGVSRNSVAEISHFLQANQISVEHRYFLESCPEEMDYDYLNFEQVTGDLHRINVMFKEIYKGKWIASGISKGGTTSIFYRYFYPEDVDVTVPYVAPVILSKEDTRIYEFFDKMGTKQCRNDIENYQKSLFNHSDELKEKLTWYYKGKGLEFSYLSFDEAYEYAVLEYPFSFWQYGHDCDLVPDKTTDIDQKLNHFIDIVGMDLFSDRDMEAYGSHYYQAGTQMGYYGYELDEFKDLIEYLPKDKNPSAVFMPEKLERPFDVSLTKKVYEWALTADQMVYINGALDTWSAAAIPANDKVNSLYYFLEGKDHATARISNMNEAELLMLQNKMKEWLLN